MKVLRIIPTMNPKKGGVAEAAKQSAILLKEENIDLEILCFDKYDDAWIKEANYTVITLGDYISYFAINLNYIPWLIKNIKKYDFVIIDGLWLFHLIGGYICKIFKIPYVVYTHGMLDPFFNQDKLKYLKKLPFWFLMDRNILSMANYVIYTCEEEKRISQNSFPFFKSKDFIITIGIPKINLDKSYLENLFYSKFHDIKDKKVILYLSRIHPKKGLDLLIDAVEEKKDILNNYIFLIAGSGDENYINILKNKISTKKLEHLFKWVGNLSGDLKWSAFQCADYFILPSHSENFGIVVAEALSFKTPVLITNKVNIYKEIEESQAGIVVDDTKDEIVKLLEKLVSLTKRDINTMSENSIKCYEKYFSQEVFKSDFKKLINKVKNEQ